MDLSGAASTDDDEQEALHIDLLTALPTTLRSLNLSHSSIPPRGLDVLPTSLTALDLSHSDVMPKNLQALGRLTALQRLNLASTAITVSSLQHIPDGVEDIDLSHCTKLIFEKGNLSYKFEFNCMTAKWPAALTTLKLAGVETSPAALFNLPPTVTDLDLSGSSFCIPNVDFTRQLPRLKTLLLENCKLNYTDEELWALPEGLEQLSLKGSSANTRHVRYLPRTLTSLNLANTLLTNYSSLYERDKVFYFFNTLHMRLPRLESLDVRCGYPYGTHKYAQLLREKVPSVLIDDAPQQHYQSSSESVPWVKPPLLRKH
ncbi:uncharacterized protein ACA1_137470 [Acanthamoeba castellanii str. Neff]|uniref:Leucine rich repeat domain containing protein n=1 Tax=Acanthamoeba castellanii (strain ATCC 30010 / Neff) TaxID=1257118 RepID=L8H1X7_ACACF|nr:uncharacterized protein ACA1_137470 [Acanthamoeba castellanii str. Neff]ELR18386.1 hypothetical protein ACA1_137470 [Acanthamoeba castellanii str. Neff]